LSDAAEAIFERANETMVARHSPSSRVRSSFEDPRLRTSGNLDKVMERGKLFDS
jgi:hypothetical protein